MLIKDVWQSPVGPLVITVNDDVLVGIDFGHTDSAKTTAATMRVKQALNRYFGLGEEDVQIPMMLNGSPFQLKVYEELVKIPFGETRTYEDIAFAIGQPKAARAVGQALHKNPIPILVPCHRVVGKDGSLTGFAGGIESKEWLLQFESAHPKKAASILYTKRRDR